MYNWDIKKIKELLEFYRNKEREAKNPEELLELENIINSIIEVLDFYHQNINPSIPLHINIGPNLSFKDIMYDDARLTKELGEYFPIVRTFNESFDYSKIKVEENLPRMKVPNPKIVALTSAFYHQQSEIFCETYSQLASNFQSRLYFSPQKKNRVFDGETKAIYGTDLVFISITKSNSLQDFTTMTHESSHGISYLLNPEVINNPSRYCLREIDSLFFELIGTEYAALLNNSPIANHLIQIITFKDYLYAADLICSKADMLSNIAPSDLYKRPLVTQYYKEEIGYDKIGLNDVMKTSIRDYFHYIISYLTVLELYFIYQEDKDYALNLLHQIIMLKDLDYHGYLQAIKELGIEPGKNASKFYDKIITEDRKLCYGKNLQL